ncbi:MAG: cation:proton antiporter [Thermaerobacter sp.]|nr:cation:proton antiporter [Thermaerobacter sp.]
MADPAVSAALLGLGLAIMLGVALGELANLLRLPDIVLFLLLGIVLGPGVGLLVPHAFPVLTQVIVLFGAAYLLFEGGRSLNGDDLRSAAAGVFWLATVGVLLTGGIVAVAGHYLLGVSWPISLLLGAVVAPTDPAVIAPLFAALPIRRRLAALALAESAANDATAASLAAVASGVVRSRRLDLLAAGGTLLWQFLVGAAVGVVLGAVSHIAERRLGQRAHTVRPLVALVAVLLSYGLASALGASGFLSAFVAGLLTGRAHRRAGRADPVALNFYEYHAGTTGRAVRILVFTLLGASLSLHVVLPLWLPAFGVVLVLILVARPLTVQLLRLDRRARWTGKEILFTSWVRETGVVPAALAALLLASGTPGAPQIAATVTVALLVTVILQVPTTRALAARLGLLSQE